jgi:hypothetical protein
MHLPKITSLLGVAAAALVALAPAAGAADTTAPKVTGAYLYVQSVKADGSKLATLVFKTDKQLPRRFDGMLRAGAYIAGQGRSIGSVNGKASRCYVASARINKDNTITGSAAGGKTKKTKARVGAKIPVEIITEKGAKTGVKKTLTLRKAKAGYGSGKPLSC